MHLISDATVLRINILPSRHGGASDDSVAALIADDQTSERVRVIRFERRRWRLNTSHGTLNCSASALLCRSAGQEARLGPCGPNSWPCSHRCSQNIHTFESDNVHTTAQRFSRPAWAHLGADERALSGEFGVIRSLADALARGDVLQPLLGPNVHIGALSANVAPRATCRGHAGRSDGQGEFSYGAQAP